MALPIVAKIEDFKDFSRPEQLRALAVQRQDMLKRRAFAAGLLKEVEFAVSTCGHDPSRRLFIWREQAMQLVVGIDADLDLFDGAVGLQF